MDRQQVVVVGAGVAGTAAALEAVRLGLGVTLVDEHPIDLPTMAMDTPYFFGPRLVPTLADRALMRERVMGSSEPLQRAREAGVSVLLGTCVWGSFTPDENSRHLTTRSLGLADGTRSWLVEPEALILAPGARDLVLAFPGCERRGVLGAQAAMALMTRYRALSAQRMVVLGSGALGLRIAAEAAERGIEVAGIVDVAARVQGPSELWAPLAARGVPFFGGHVVQRVEGDKDVEGMRLVPVGGATPTATGAVTELACDTVCLAVGLVPNVELPYLAQCRLSYRGNLGGWVPDRDESLQTSRERVYVAGDGGGVHDTMVADPGVAAAQGRLAAMAAAEALGALPPSRAQAMKQELGWARTVPSPATEADGRGAWVHALVAAGGLDVVACPCEGVTRRELLDVAPPRYLAWSPPGAWSSKMATVTTEDRSAHPDLLKRLTRAGMGHCQGRRCREQVALLLADAAGIDVSTVPLASYRPPVRPLPMKVLWPEDEPEAVRQRWAGWFSPWYKVHG
jgi:D-hydroxyproline dehydrogenase subunit alpha